MPPAIDPHRHDYYDCLLKINTKGMKLRWPWTHEKTRGKTDEPVSQSFEQKCSLQGVEGGVE